MKKITLPPNAWTRFDGSSFQPRPPAEIKITTVWAKEPDDIVAPDISTDAFITNSGVTDQLLDLEYLRREFFTAVYLMPVGSSSAATVISA
ncbi:hypothetical protein Rleg9DRAFT_2096 [Rhizobium leguminosarum bv. trifolii WSM597]|uniref:Uncharacterized protein n=1 Tax=Rhizobium leguminosarum bv. trifolii WSM597 TaxID=754764 RepID=I9N5R8_RHILT|nr:hypothetical protein [Rhizobium leguminosarum]EJB03264.1 hypothetical protein Rleg9DRAFT_2096 [Rhizobium leguminosarum bv. trifolii WSM597]